MPVDQPDRLLGTSGSDITDGCGNAIRLLGWTRTLLLNILFAQPLACEYAELFRGLDDSELEALADSFALANCSARETLRSQLEKS